MSTGMRAVVMCVALCLVSGCTSSAKHEEAVATKDKQIKTLNSELGLLSEKNRQLTNELEQSKGRASQFESEASSSKRSEEQFRQLLSEKDQRLTEKDQQIAYLRRANEKAMSRPPTVIATPMAQQGGGGAAAGGGTAGAAPGGGGKYHLRIISLPNNSHNEKVAREIAAYLTSKGVADVNARLSGGRHWVVDIGNFSSIRSAEAESLKKQIRDMSYKGIRQFKDAYFATY